MKKQNVVMIIIDQQVNYTLLPQKLLDFLPGYNA